MKDIQVSIDRIVVDFTDVFWDFFNQFHSTLRTHFNARFNLQEKGFKYHLHVRDGGHYLHISYQLAFVPKSRKNVLRIECHPESLVHFKSWLLPLRKVCRDVLFVRCDVAFDIPLPITELFTLSLTGRNMHTWKGTRYSNQMHQRQVAGYCRVYDKKLEKAEKQGKKISGELTRFEIVYAPTEKIPLHMLVQYPPSFNKYYLCSHLVSLEKLKPKLLERINGIMNGDLEQRQVTGYYRREIEKEMRTRPTLDFDSVAAEQWENAIAIPCAILVGVVSKVPVA
ncbi:replication initiation factor family protein [Paenibacillus alvei]|uniref:Replication initiation factor family protein n=1 Tax=Paenibacillus alvei TaxID=44250 RepID=A0AAP7A5A5_PAEAL|nr:replication initiation factor family protein [Paenibacillus alvei]NOJ74157.1 replication initiation factor family protein [Paenibacillus alvei]